MVMSYASLSLLDRAMNSLPVLTYCTVWTYVTVLSPPMPCTRGLYCAARPWLKAVTIVWSPNRINRP